MKYGELKMKLKWQNCYKVRDGVNHEIWYSGITGCLFTVGRHDSEEVKTGTLRSIVKISGIKI